ncbi:MAG: hypothetical protein Q7U53_19025 [Anaerolineaceae bacterium]|nr:hypothetical protein [Anaerolineaceae bacterium]
MKIKIVLMLLMMVLLLTACNGSESLPVQNQENAVDNVENAGINTPSEPVDNQTAVQNQEMVQLGTQTRLILGSMALLNNDQLVSPEQAEKLIPLWKVLKNLLASDTAASAEIEALLTQIQSELSPEQLERVNDFNLSPQDYQEILSKYVPEEFQNTSTLMTEEEREERRATAIAANGGTVPQELQSGGGGRGMGGGSGIPGGVPGGSAGTTDGLGQRAGGGAGQINSFLIDALVAELELIHQP